MSAVTSEETSQSEPRPDAALFKPDSAVIDKLTNLQRTHALDALGYMVWELYRNKSSIGEMNQRLL